MAKLILSFLITISVVFAEPNGTCPPDEDPTAPTFLGDTSDCKVYYTCYLGTALPSVCPEGLEWHATNRYCDYPENAQCSTGSTTSTPAESTTTDPTNKPFGLCPPREDTEETVTYLPDAEDCSKFYKCFFGQPVPQYCPPGLEWSLESTVCDWPDQAQCERPLTLSL